MNVVIGVITKPYGLLGDVKIKSTTDFASKRFKKDNEVTLYNPLKEETIKVTILSYKKVSGIDVVRFVDYDTPEKVKQLVGYQIIIDNVDEKVPKNTYHYKDLYGCDVYNKEELIGKVIDVINNGASIVLRIKCDNRSDILYPFIDKFIENIDIENKVIKLNPIQGMLS